MVRTLGTDAMLRRLEAEEERNIAQFDRHAQALVDDVESHALFARIEDEEKQHATMLHALKQQDEPRTRLEALMEGREVARLRAPAVGSATRSTVSTTAWARSSASVAAWPGDRWSQVVLVSRGCVTLLASALSMGSGAYLAASRSGSD